MPCCISLFLFIIFIIIVCITTQLIVVIVVVMLVFLLFIYLFFITITFTIRITVIIIICLLINSTITFTNSYFIFLSYFISFLLNVKLLHYGMFLNIGLSVLWLIGCRVKSNDLILFPWFWSFMFWYWFFRAIFMEIVWIDLFIFVCFFVFVESV